MNRWRKVAMGIASASKAFGNSSTDELGRGRAMAKNISQVWMTRRCGRKYGDGNNFSTIHYGHARITDISVPD